jgi:hypothetical protein
VQRELGDRGGMFRSKEDNLSKHKSLRKVWRDAKIALANTIIKFEDLVGEIDVPEQDTAKLREALEIWEVKKVVLGRVPGLVYAEGAEEEEEPSEEDKEVARLMMELLKMALEKEMTAEEKQATTKLKPRGPYQKGVPDGLHQPLPIILEPPSFPSRRSASRQKVFAVLPVGSLESPAEAQHNQPATPEPSSSPDTGQPRAAIPQPILKRCASRSPPSSSTSSPQHKRKRVRTASFATISSEALSIANPSPFANLSHTPTVQPHAPHTIAENKRRRSAFHRGTMQYLPGVWASGAFSEKANTSYLGVEWDVMSSAIRRELGEEDMEKKLAAELKEISGQWVVSWWTKNIVPTLDIEKLKCAMKTEKR